MNDDEIVRLFDDTGSGDKDKLVSRSKSGLLTPPRTHPIDKGCRFIKIISVQWLDTPEQVEAAKRCRRLTRSNCRDLAAALALHPGRVSTAS